MSDIASGEAGDEEALESRTGHEALDPLEEILEGTVAVDELLVGLLVVGQDLVGEIVVFVDQEVETIGCLQEDREELFEVVEGILAQLQDFRQMLAVGPLEDADRHVQIAVDLVADPLVVRADLCVDAPWRWVRIDLGEVPAHHEVAVGQRGGAAAVSPLASPGGRVAHGQTAKEDLVILGCTQVVVVGQDAQPQGLAEAPRTQEEQGPAELLQGPDVLGAVDVEQVVGAEAVEVGDAVRDLHDLFLSTTENRTGAISAGSRRPCRTKVP